MYHRIREIRATKPIFAMDFQNDGEYVGGCIAGGRRYLHINANGDVDPCVFIHYSNANIRELHAARSAAKPDLHGLSRRPAVQRQPCCVPARC